MNTSPSARFFTITAATASLLPLSQSETMPAPVLVATGKTQVITSPADMNTPELPLPHALHRILALAVCCQNRWADGARAALRQIWHEAESDAAAADAVGLLAKVLSPQERYWLATFDGDRKKMPA